MQKLIDLIKESTGATSDGLAWAMLIVAALIIVFGCIGIGISIALWFKYHRLNKQQNSCGFFFLGAGEKINDNFSLLQIL